MEVPSKHFSELNKIISRFIWQGKKIGIYVKLPKEEGGMVLPKLKAYYSAAQIKPLINICTPTYQARWKDIELSLINDPPISAVLPHKNLAGFIHDVKNPFLKAQLKIWNTVRDEYKLEDKLQMIHWCVYACA